MNKDMNVKRTGTVPSLSRINTKAIIISRDAVMIAVIAVLTMASLSHFLQIPIWHKSISL